MSYIETDCQADNDNKARHKKKGVCSQCGGCRKCPPPGKVDSPTVVCDGDHIGTFAKRNKRSHAPREQSLRTAKSIASDRISEQISGTCTGDTACEVQELREEVVAEYDTLTVSMQRMLISVENVFEPRASVSG